MTKPKIGITTAWSVESWGDSIESRGYNYAGRTYIEAITSAGGIPILIPQTDHKDISELLNLFDGLLFTGGGDARRFSKDDLPDLREQQPARYDFEEELMKLAKKEGKPILGICRGFQMMIEVFGGSLSKEVIDGHKQGLDGGKPGHKVSIEKESFLFNIVNDLQWDVNSFHIQKVEKVPVMFKTVAIAEDGVVEAIESINDSFILGVQFHPEELLWGDSRAYMIFKEFIKLIENKGGK